MGAPFVCAAIPSLCAIAGLPGLNFGTAAAFLRAQGRGR